MREKPLFSALFHAFWEFQVSAGMAGWRRSAHRTRLHLNSLQTGNLTGKITVSGLKAAIWERETAVPQGLFSRFPTQTNREITSGIREFNER
jgi:hypothetical protein